MPTYRLVPEVDFDRRCPSCSNRCQAEVVRRSVTPTDSITSVYAVCKTCQ
jgi:C4-type Zn-finger protein